MPNNSFMRWIEGRGLALRRKITGSPYDVLDPFALARRMNVHVISPYEVDLPKDAVHYLLNVDSKCWSAGCIKLPDGKALILYNPTHANVRIHSTIMEELAHLFLGHKNTKITKINGDLCRRNYRPSDEKQAYAVGSAALIPSALLKKAMGEGISRSMLAMTHKVSEQLLGYRENITGIKLK